jgi:molybdenum cofactor cytidylyltransferase
MRLGEAFRLGEGEIVAFVGGGGKTTAMFRLAGELVRAGKRVVTTTTTRIFAAQIGRAPVHASVESGAPLPEGVPAALERHHHVLVTGPVDPAAGKAFGVDPALIPQLARLPGVAAVLIEADGSRMRPLKAPAEHEPVIPPEATLVVPVMGAEALNQPLSEARVHRVELVCLLTGAAEGDRITPELAARVLTHPQGGLKNIPAGARVIPLINKVESEAELALARETAAHLVRHSGITAAAIGAVRREEAGPVREVHASVTGVVLAAGRSTRMGRPKQVLPWGEGGTMIGEVVRRLQTAGLGEIVVVTGAAHDHVTAALAAARVRLAFNPDFASSEMAQSLQVGLRLAPAHSLAVLVALGDQPQIEPEVVRALCQRWRETLAPVVVPVYRGQRGNPVLFDRSVWPHLFNLPASANPREAVRAASHIEQVEVQTDSILSDVDTPEDYARERPA